MQKKFKEIFGKTDDVFREYSMVLLMAFLAAIAFMATARGNDNLNHNDFVFMKFGMVACLGISLLFALKMLSQRIGKGIFLEIAGVLFLIGFYFLLPDREKDFTEFYAFLLIPTFILSHLLVSFVAFFGEKKELNFWQYNKNLFINVFLTAVFTGVLIGGVELAILAVDKLFDFNFDNHYYLQTFYFLSIFGSAFIFLLFNEKGLKDLEKDGTYPLILKFFTQYILIPLLLIYAVILYFYGAKILINWELPRGWVSYLVLAYSVVGILGLLLVHPLKEEVAKSWVKIFSKIFYYTLIPLIALLFTAIFTRILEYGYTEPRYFVLLLALWLTAVVFYFIFVRSATIKFIPMSLFVFGLFSLIFPYLNTFSVAKRSQKNELMQTLKQNHLLQSGKINFNTAIKTTTATEISDKFKFLAERKEQEFLTTLVDEKTQVQVKKNIKEGNFYAIQSDIQKQFKNITFDTESKNSPTASNSIILKAKSSGEDISGYKYLFKAQNYKANKFTFENNTIEFNLFGNGEVNGQLNIIFNNKPISLNEDLKELFNSYTFPGETEVDHLWITKKIDNYEVKILFDGITLLNKGTKDQRYFINSESVIILIK